MGIQFDNKEVGKNGRYMQDDKMVQNCLRMYQVLQRYGRSKKFEIKVFICFFVDYLTIMGFELFVN